MEQNSQKKRIISQIDPKYSNKDWWSKKYRTAAYGRVSTDKNDQLNSLANQRDHYTDMISKHPNWEFVAFYADEGISGTSLKNRTAFKTMVEDCKAGKIDLVVVKEVARFARNVIDCLNTVEELLTLDPPVGIYFENNHLNTLDMTNKIFLTVFAMFAELESDLKSRSVEFGIEQIYDRRDYPSCSGNLLGYKRSAKYKMVIDPAGAQTVRMIFDMFLAGYSCQEIADALNSLSRTTVKGNPWSSAAIAGILRNERYCGDIIMRKRYTVSFLTHETRRNTGQRRLFYEPDHHEPIVTREESARSLLLMNADHASPYFNHAYEIEIIRDGLLSGFIPMNPVFGGYDAGHYLGAYVMARLPEMDMETEIAHIAGVKRVRRELFGASDTPSLTFDSHGLSFNTPCVSLLEGAPYVEMLLNPSERLFAVRETSRENRNAIHWQSGAFAARALSGVLYELMDWRAEWKYRATANCFARGRQRVIIFDMNHCEFRLRDADSMPKRGFPSRWLTEFGNDLPEYMALCRRALAVKLRDWEIDAPPMPVEGFINSFVPLTRAEVEKRIAEMSTEYGYR